jgi:hypothetical protein
MAVSHKNIRRFYLDGEIYDEAAIPRVKDQYLKIVCDMMGKKGYIRRIDIDPDFTVQYNGRTFNFEMSVYGIYLGKRKCEQYLGIDKNRLILKPILKSKSDEYYLPAG